MAASDDLGERLERLLQEISGLKRQIAVIESQVGDLRGRPASDGAQAPSPELVSRTFDFASANDPLDGIIKYLMAKDDHFVIASSSSFLNDDFTYSASQTLNSTTRHCFHSKNEKNQWIMFDFESARVAPTWYSIRSYNGANWHHPMFWVLEASNDAVNWHALEDQHRNSEEFVGCQLVTKSYELAGSQGSFRYIRLKQTGPSALGSHYLGLSAFEVFGTLTTVGPV
jgi:hypothetical protein